MRQVPSGSGSPALHSHRGSFPPQFMDEVRLALAFQATGYPIQNFIPTLVVDLLRKSPSTRYLYSRLAFLCWGNGETS